MTLTLIILYGIFLYLVHRSCKWMAEQDRMFQQKYEEYKRKRKENKP